MIWRLQWRNQTWGTWKGIPGRGTQCAKALSRPLWKNMDHFVFGGLCDKRLNSKTRLLNINGDSTWKKTTKKQKKKNMIQSLEYISYQQTTAHGPTACFCNKSFIGSQPHSFVCIVPLATFTLQQQRWVAAQTWKSNIFTLCPFKKKFANSERK